ncbi:hypothetical protein H4R99_005375 [Coemansia sp. RSA 1722]|nr:hypothetical protein LPJ57_007925 [Coemansia sp. RSA 486]KAJ2230861.1 hypothetical protein IWW45_005645 [Coemansia sp. RSA 485]KAJ2595385.1 hypothetical protein H4R99_005375 [Coemansia sp. RSA 1722]
MPLNDITTRANNAPSTRQPTLFASLQASGQRRHKRRSAENSREDQTTKRVCVKSIDTDAAPSSKQSQVIKSLLTPMSIRSALRLRQHMSVPPCNISTIHMLEGMASSAERAYHTPEAGGGRQLPLACRYSPNGDRLALVDEAGCVSMFDTSIAGPISPQNRWQAHAHAVFDAAWSYDGSMLVTAAADDTCRLWDAESGALKGEFRGHSKTVRAIDWRHMDGSCFASGARDGSVLFWDTRCNKARGDDTYSYRPVSTIAQAHAQGRRQGRRASMAAVSVTGLRHLRHDPHLVATVGAAAATVRLWDVRMTQSARSSAFAKAISESIAPQGRARGVASLALDPDGTRLYAPCNDGHVYVHNAAHLGEPVCQLGAPEFECRGFGSGAASSSCGRYLASGSATGAVVVWELDRVGANSSGRRAVLQGHIRDAGCVAWNPQRLQLASCADDGLLRLWDCDSVEAERGRSDVANRCRWGFATVH